MPYITVGKENGANIDIYYKDWGKGQPIVFSHGWPLSADDWDAQMLFFLGKGFRVIAHDRRGHGRSTQTGGGHDMDHYADDLAALTAHLDLKNAVHVGHSTGGGEVAHYLGRHGESRVAKAALISAVPPLMVKTEKNPGGLPKEVFDGLQAQLAANRSQFYRDLPAGPFYGFNRQGVKSSEAIIQNWWRQGMMGGAKAHYDGIVAFSQTDFTEDLKKITVPVLVMHGDDDQIVPYADSAPLSAKLLKNSTLKTYKGFPHGMPTTQADTINADLLAFIAAIFTGIVVVFGMIADKRLDSWTKWFLTTAVLTTVTGFFFPFHGFTPAIGLGIISLPFLALTIYARYPKHLAGAWRWIYAIGAVICLYFNLFVLVVQLFEKVPALHAMAPTQTESPFKLTQVCVLVVSVVLAIIAVIRFHPEPSHTV